MRIISLLSVALLTCYSLSAQYYRPENKVWALSDKVGIDFNFDPPQVIKTSLTTSTEGTATICDSNGSLLFYTTGADVWDKEGNLMPNGKDFTKSGSFFSVSTTQAAAIVPLPEQPGKYYIFSLSSVANCKLYCSLLDMNLNGGKGDIDTTFDLLGKRLDSNLTEKMTVASGCQSVWLLVHSDTGAFFKAYNIDRNGLNLNPVISKSGQFSGKHYTQGVIKVSPDGKRILTCNFRATFPDNAGVEVFDFNPSTGAISNPVFVDSGSYYGGAFSPNNQLIYVSSTATMNSGGIYQFNLSEKDINASKLFLGVAGQYTDIKLAYNGKMYFGALPGGGGWSNYLYFGSITYPDSAGLSCQFRDSITELTFPTVTSQGRVVGLLRQGLANDIAFPRTYSSTNSITMKVCPNDSVIYNIPDAATNVIWSDGSTELSRAFYSPGKYWVNYEIPCLISDTIEIIDTFPSWDISVNEQTLSSSYEFDSYQWYLDEQIIEGATEQELQVMKNGLYKLEVKLDNCRDEKSYQVNNSTTVNDYDAGIYLYPNPVQHTLHIKANHNTELYIIDLNGKEFFLGKNITSYNFSNWSNGSYIVKCVNPETQKASYHKLVILN